MKLKNTYMPPPLSTPVSLYLSLQWKQYKYVYSPFNLALGSHFPISTLITKLLPEVVKDQK